MLLALKQRIAPTDRAREVEHITQHQKLKEPAQNHNIDEWIKKWETTYANCKEMDLPDVAGTRPIHDFLDAVRNMAPEFTSFWRVQIQVLEHNNQQIPDIYEILESFRDNIRLSNAEKTRVIRGAFPATFQGQKAEGAMQNEQKDKPSRPCLC